MHVFIRLILSVILTITFAGCAHHKTTPEQAFCFANCKQRLVACTQTCVDSCLQCGMKADISTVKSYNHYKREQCLQGGILARDLKSYRDPLQCRKATCECRADYDVCMQSCTGVIRKRLQIAPVCC